MHINLKEILFFIIVSCASAKGQVNYQLIITDVIQRMGRSVVETSDGGFLLGTSFNTTYLNTFNSALTGDGLLIKTDSAGAIIWSNTYYISGSAIFDSACAIIDMEPLADGGLIALAQIPAHMFTNTSLVIFRIDAIGNIVWSDAHYSSQYDEVIPIELVKLSDSTFICAAQKIPQTGSSSTYIVRYNTNGLVTGQSATQLSVLSKRIISTNDRGYLIIGNNVISAFDSLDVFKWGKVYFYNTVVRNQLVEKTSDNGYVVELLANLSPLGHNYIVLFKTDSAGNFLYGKTLLTSNSIYPVSLKELPNKDLLLVYNAQNPSQPQVSIVRVDSLLNITAILTSSNSIIAWDVKLTSNNGLVISGRSDNTNAGDAGIFMWKTDFNFSSACNFISGVLSSTTLNPAGMISFNNSSATNISIVSSPGLLKHGVSENDTISCPLVVSAEFADKASDKKISIYPNPAKNVLLINSRIYSKNAIIKIYDVMGNLVYEKIKTDCNSAFIIDVSLLSRGIYFVWLFENGIGHATKFIK